MSFYFSQRQLVLWDTWRLLWEQHVWWTRNVINSIAFNSPDEQAATQRLLQNPTDMGAALVPFYGEEKASPFTRLMKDHLILAVELVKAAKAGNKKLAAAREKQWYANAVEIAAYMNSINPFWPKDAIKSMLDEHLSLTKSEAVSILNGNYAEGIGTFDKIEKQALTMANAFAEGIMRQFHY